MKTNVLSSLIFCLLLSILVAPVFAAAKESDDETYTRQIAVTKPEGTPSMRTEVVKAETTKP